MATSPAGAARGMVRISGPDAIAVVSRCFRSDDAGALRRLSRPGVVSGDIRVDFNVPGAPAAANAPSLNFPSVAAVPCDAFVWPTHRSYTREPAVELHTMGSPPLLEGIVSAVCRAGARLAEPGEFTLRAFLAGRLDLTQAEAVLGVIDASGETELKAALSQLAGGLAGRLHELRDELLQLLAELEAGLDFVDEDIQFVTPEDLVARLSEARRLLDDIAGQMSRRHAVTGAPQVALVGAPNVGKSSLFNALVARYSNNRRANDAGPTAALVSPRRGTTRDYLTAMISLDGIHCELVDTAGVDAASTGTTSAAALNLDPQPSNLETSAQAMASQISARAMIRLHCIEAKDFVKTSSPMLEDRSKTLSLPMGEGRCEGESRQNSAPSPYPLPTGEGFETRSGSILVLTKSDLVRGDETLVDGAYELQTVATSSHSGAGLAELTALLRKLLFHDQAAQRAEVIPSTADRCQESIRRASAAVEKAEELVRTTSGDELIAVEIRAAIHELGKVVGAVYTDDLLDRIFKTFCIGK